MKWTNNEKNKIAQLVTIGLTDKEAANRVGKTKASVKHYRQRHLTNAKIEDAKAK